MMKVNREHRSKTVDETKATENSLLLLLYEGTSTVSVVVVAGVVVEGSIGSVWVELEIRN